jgi:S1-C subfamily serine protease
MLIARRAPSVVAVALTVATVVACQQPGRSSAPSGSVSAGGSSAALDSASPAISQVPSAATTGGSAAPGGSPASPGASTGGVVATVPTSIPDLVAQVQPQVVAVLRSDGGQGSGVIWSADGDVVTNNHVVEGVDSVTVAFADGQRMSGSVLATDPRSDLAVVRTKRTGLPKATFRDDLPRVGELALAIGNPLGFEESVTEGIISGLNRAIPGAAQNAPALVDLIQTDAGISPGNSGGALVAGDGRVMGINVAYIPPTAGAVAIGFAIPSPTVIDVVTQLIQSGRAEHAFLGVTPVTVDAQLAQSYQLPVNEGAIVAELVRDGPAAKAGAKPGDIITAIDDQPVRTAEDLLSIIRKHKPGDRVTLAIHRQERQLTLDVTLGDLPSS